MSRRNYAIARKQRFADVLSAYRERHGINVTQLAELLGKPRSTVLHWMSTKNRRCPKLGELPRLCSRLNVNFDTLFSSAATRDWFFDRQILGFPALQMRYFEVFQEDALSALNYLSVAGALVFNRLAREAIECSLQIGHDYLVTFKFHSEALSNLSLLVQARGTSGIGFLVVTSDNQEALSWRCLTDPNLDICVDYLQNLL